MTALNSQAAALLVSQRKEIYKTINSRQAEIAKLGRQIDKLRADNDVDSPLLDKLDQAIHILDPGAV